MGRGMSARSSSSRAAQPGHRGWDAHHGSFRNPQGKESCAALPQERRLFGLRAVARFARRGQQDRLRVSQATARPSANSAHRDHRIWGDRMLPRRRTWGRVGRGVVHSMP